MLARALGALTLILALTTGGASAQNAAGGEEPVAAGTPPERVDRRPQGGRSGNAERRRLRDRRALARRPSPPSPP